MDIFKKLSCFRVEIKERAVEEELKAGGWENRNYEEQMIYHTYIQNNKIRQNLPVINEIKLA